MHTSAYRPRSAESQAQPEGPAHGDALEHSQPHRDFYTATSFPLRSSVRRRMAKRR